jgi:hypothetical protein
VTDTLTLPLAQFRWKADPQRTVGSFERSGRAGTYRLQQAFQRTGSDVVEWRDVVVEE